MFDLIIRRMEEKDIDDVWEIEKISFKSPWAKATFENEMKNKIAYYIVAEVSGEVAGYAGSWIAFGHIHITTLAVHPYWRRKKIGKVLLLNLFKKAIKQDVKVAILEVRADNVIAQNIYTAFGFEVVGKRRRYYQNGEDALIMACPKIQSENFLNKITEEEIKFNRFLTL